MKVLMHRIALIGGVGLLVMAVGTACTLTGAEAPLTPSGGGDFIPEAATPTVDLGFLPTPDPYDSPDVFGDLTATVSSDPFAVTPIDEGPTGFETPTPMEVVPVFPDTGVTPELVMTPVEPVATATPFEVVPVATTTPLPPSGDISCPTSYTVQSGDTLFRIALRYGLTVQELASANGITNPDSVSVGTVLTIPCGGTTGGGTGVTAGTGGDIQHVVQAGENLFRIALQYGLTWERVAEYNGITNPNNISVGQVILIPPN
ncbi:MAG: LysM peptidoglycan-binding domain-containing protein [Anaerolineae bacterium]|nr:LysM peptidoglycan-binding domain-containing protein [Anaerolineae bacterium]